MTIHGLWEAFLIEVTGARRLLVGSISLSGSLSGCTFACRCYARCSSTVNLSIPYRKRAWTNDYSSTKQGLSSTFIYLSIARSLGQIDMPAADPLRVIAQLQSTFGIDAGDVLQISAKTGFGVENILQVIIERIPPPSGSMHEPLKALLFDSQ